MSLSLQEALPSLVRNKYNAAKAAGALVFAESHLTTVKVAGVRLQLRFCPSLAKKPTKQREASSGPKKRIDPFLNPDQQLFVTNAPDKANASHIIVLNKFPIIHNHFILATTSDALKQEQLLDEDDLVRTFECLKEWESVNTGNPAGQKRLFGFFNSGDHSGASQPHRHIQFLPVEDMQGPKGDDGWNLLVEDILDSPKVQFFSYQFHVHPKLPFVHFGLRLPPEFDGEYLLKCYTDLLKAAIASVRHFRRLSADELTLQPTENRGCAISYNLGMSTSGMVICARRSEGKEITRPDGSAIDTVALNGTFLGGTLMVKSEEVFSLLQEDSSKLVEVLRAAGIPAGSGYENFEQNDLIENTGTLKFTL